MTRSYKTTIVAGLALLLAGVAPAVAGTPDEAKALCEKAAALVVAEGEKAFAKIDDPAGEFVQGDLNVAVFDHTGVMRAHMNPKLVGINMWESSDPDGAKFVQDQLKIGDTAGSGWYTWKYVNIVTKKIGPKKGWVQKAGEFTVISSASISAQ
jgi:hypothetical protein